MRQLFFLFLILILCRCSPSTSKEESFRLHLFSEPQQLDPAKARSSSASYFFFSILRGIYTYDNEKGLVPENGKCHWVSKKNLQCHLDENFKWSDGSPVQAEDYKRAFLHLINPTTAAPRAQLLFHLKNASSIFAGKKNPESLGFEIKNPFSFNLLFEKADPEFTYKLTSTALFPRHKSDISNKNQYKDFISNGPYKIKDWKNQQEVLLDRNEFYPKGNPKRPNVLFYIIDNDLTAFRLYESGQMDFLRRTLTQFVKKLKTRDDFYQIPQARFDYIGFGGQAKNNFHLRKALALSIDYSASKKVLEALGPLGCPSVPREWLDTQPCYPFDVKEAKKALAQVSPQTLKKKIYYGFSMLGGETLKRQTEFLQGQWKKNLGLDVEVQMMEQKMYLKTLRTKPMTMFRKGVGLDRGSCTDALETFSKISSENYAQWFNSQYEKLIEHLAQESSLVKRKKLCRQAISILMKEFRVIPLGEMHFTILARPKFKGWKLNEINMLDLSQLKVSQP